MCGFGCFFSSLYIDYELTHSIKDPQLLLPICTQWASQVALVVRNSPTKAGDIKDVGSIPGSESSGREHGNPFHVIV